MKTKLLYRLLLNNVRVRPDGFSAEYLEDFYLRYRLHLPLGYSSYTDFKEERMRETTAL